MGIHHTSIDLFRPPLLAHFWPNISLPPPLPVSLFLKATLAKLVSKGSEF